MNSKNEEMLEEEALDQSPTQVDDEEVGRVPSRVNEQIKEVKTGDGAKHDGEKYVKPQPESQTEVQTGSQLECGAGAQGEWQTESETDDQGQSKGKQLMKGKGKESVKGKEKTKFKNRTRSLTKRQSQHLAEGKEEGRAEKKPKCKTTEEAERVKHDARIMVDDETGSEQECFIGGQSPEGQADIERTPELAQKNPSTRSATDFIEALIKEEATGQTENLLKMEASPHTEPPTKEVTRLIDAQKKIATLLEKEAARQSEKLLGRHLLDYAHDPFEARMMIDEQEPLWDGPAPQPSPVYKVPRVKAPEFLRLLCNNRTGRPPWPLAGGVKFCYGIFISSSGVPEESHHMTVIFSEDTFVRRCRVLESLVSKNEYSMGQSMRKLMEPRYSLNTNFKQAYLLDDSLPLDSQLIRKYSQKQIYDLLQAMENQDALLYSELQKEEAGDSEIKKQNEKRIEEHKVWVESCICTSIIIGFGFLGFALGCKVGIHHL